MDMFNTQLSLSSESGPGFSARKSLRESLTIKVGEDKVHCDDIDSINEDKFL